jgi:hypothetical protein
MSREDHTEAIFRDGKELEVSLAALTETCAKTDWQIHLRSLLPNPTSGRHYANMETDPLNPDSS